MSRWFPGASIAILSWPAGPATAQSAGFRGPISGFNDRQGSRTVRLLPGASGAAHLGTAIMNRLALASVGPDGKWALIAKDGRCVLIRGLVSLAHAESSTDGLIDAVGRVPWTRDGQFEALFAAPTFLSAGDNRNEWLPIRDVRQLRGTYLVPAKREKTQ